jgi:hypothetical protein
MTAPLSTEQPSSDWTPTTQLLPPEGHVVEAMDCGGHIHRLQLHRRLWFIEDMSMYVYFTPTHWRPIQQQNKP